MGKITDALKKAAEERLGRIERMSNVRERDQLIIKKMRDSKVDASIIAYFDPKAVITEQYKILRTNLLSMNKSKPPKVFVVTSSLPGEGKTVTSLNLAFVLAQSMNKPRVLFVDADMRRGRAAKYLGVDQEVGFTEYLEGKASMEDVMFRLEDENLSFVVAGGVPENPAELLASDRMKQFIDQARTNFDHVIIDTPPIISVTDAGIVGAMVDGVMIVIQAGRTQRGIVKRAEEFLHQAHSNVLGHVLTNIQYHLPEYIYRYLYNI
jgi:capsular exopolysaccharide synthesis family protein